MSSPSHPVSLPSIHELFPEHLMNPSKTHPTTTRRHQDHARATPPNSTHVHHGQPSRHSSGPLHTGGQRHATDYPVHPPRPHDAPHHPPRTADGPYAQVSHPMSSIQVDRDTYQRSRQGHLAVPIPPAHPVRTPRTQDRTPHPDPRPTLPSDRSHAWSIPHSGPSPMPSAFDDPENLSDEDTPTAPSGVPRKHICSICRKAFNRPSSLKIHYNTHTGATPFRCPWPKCGREFNVNSNMRRHLRNHTANNGQEIQEDGVRRRRRRSSASSTSPLVTTAQQSASEPRALPQGNIPRHQAPPPHYAVPSHVPEKAHHYMRYRVHDYDNKDYHGMDVDEMDDYRASEDLHRHIGVSVPITRNSDTPAEPRGAVPLPPRYHGLPAPHEDNHFHHHSHSSSSASMLIRALTPGSSFHSSSPSPSPSPSLSPTSSSFNSPPPSTFTSPVQSPAILPRTHPGQQIQYSPSMPYLRGVRDSYVSTALRPAFNAGNNVVPRR